MMAPVLIFAPCREDEERLRNSRWIARKAASLLGSTRTIEDHDAVRATFESTLASIDFSGVLFCGHGDKHAVFGADHQQVLDEANLSSVRAFWVHLIACEAGRDLVSKFAISHEALFVGYMSKVAVEFTLESLPPELEPLLIDVVTAATLALDSGQRDKAMLQRRVEAARQALLDWMYTNDRVDEFWALEWFTQTLVERMVTNR